MNEDREDQSSFETYCMCHPWSIGGKKKVTFYVFGIEKP